MSRSKPPTLEEIQSMRDRLRWLSWISVAITLVFLTQIFIPDMYRRFMSSAAFGRLYLVSLFVIFIYNGYAIARYMGCREKILRIAHDNAMRICPKCFHPADRTQGNDFQCTECGDWYSISQVRKYLQHYPFNFKPPRPLRKGDGHP